MPLEFRVNASTINTYQKEVDAVKVVIPSFRRHKNAKKI
jgi:hypothetical protein